MNTPYPFLPVILACLLWLAAGLMVLYLVAGFSIKIYEDMLFAKCKRMAKANPGIGSQDGEGNFVYKVASVTFKYRLVQGQEGGPQAVKCIAFKRRLTGYEEAVMRVKGTMHAFWLYKKWRNALKLKFLIPIVAVLAILYFMGFESDESKIHRLRWMVARTLHVGIDAVAVDPAGNVVVSGERRPKDGGQPEQVSYNFNVADWLMLGDAGFVMRKIPSLRQEKVYPVQYYDNGTVTMRKDDKLLGGEFKGNALRWNNPQGNAQIQSENIHGEDTLRPAGKVLVVDK